MNTSMPPEAGELPSPARLRRATFIAIGVAALLLVTVVMPAECGVDPTGVGRVLGPTEMGEIRQQLAREAAEAEAAVRMSEASAAEPPVAGDHAASRSRPTKERK